MESESNLSAHVVNLLHQISIESTKEDSNQFFVPLLPSLPINLNIFNDPSSLIDEFKLDEVPQPNPLQWLSQNNKSISETFQTFFNNPDFEGTDNQNNPENVDDEIESELKQIHRKQQTALKSNEMQKFQSLQIEKNELIGENKAKFLGNNIAAFENSKIQGHQNKLKVGVEQLENFKKFCKNGQVDNEFIKLIKYDSSKEQISILNQSDQQLAQKLKKFGLGHFQQTQSQSIPLENCMSKLEVEVEWCKINFKREWIHDHIFQSNHFGIQNEEKYSWSNGTKFQQDETAKLPYLTVGAVVGRNIVIQGIQSNNQVLEAQQVIEKNKQNSHALFFKLSDSDQFKKSELNDSLKIELNAPRILGFNLIEIHIDQGKQKIEEQDTIVQVKIDDKNQTYTLGLGQMIEYCDSHENFNQKFGDPCILGLITKENTDFNLKQKCKKIIMHEIGKIIGLKREQIYDENIEFNKDEVIKFFKNYLNQLNAIADNKLTEQELQDEAQKLAEEQIFVKHHVSNFEKPDNQSIMYIPYPKSWIKKPENYIPVYNYRLSESDRQLLSKYFDVNLGQAGSNEINNTKQEQPQSQIKQQESNDDIKRQQEQAKPQVMEGGSEGQTQNNKEKYVQVLVPKDIYQIIENYINEYNLLDEKYTIVSVKECFEFDEFEFKSQYENWESFVEEVYNQLKKPDDQASDRDPFRYDLPDIKTIEQKKVLKSQLEKDDVKDKMPPPG